MIIARNGLDSRLRTRQLLLAQIFSAFTKSFLITSHISNPLNLPLDLFCSCCRSSKELVGWWCYSKVGLTFSRLSQRSVVSLGYPAYHITLK